jgi:hypothetical protein
MILTYITYFIGDFKSYFTFDATLHPEFFSSIAFGKSLQNTNVHP